MTSNTAWAIEVKPENFSLLISEGGKGYTKDDIWGHIQKYNGGYFLRDPSSKLDCNFFEPASFLNLYQFRWEPDGRSRSPLLEVVKK